MVEFRDPGSGDGGYVARTATHDDLDVMSAMSRARRTDLAAWSPAWWAKAASADEIHPAWLEHLIGGGAERALVIERDGVIVGCACALDQGTQYFVDDLAIASGHHVGAVAALDAATAELRPALACIPTRDLDTLDAFLADDRQLVSTYWVNRTARGPVEVGPFSVPPMPAPTRHTFGGRPFDPSARGALAFSCPAGSVSASPSIDAPPVYDPGGTVTIADLVTGPDLAGALVAALRLAGERGDVLVAVVCAAGDRELAAALDRTGFQRTVEVVAFAGRPPIAGQTTRFTPSNDRRRTPQM